MIWVGVTIALVGALGYALGAALQQYEAVRDGATLKLVKRRRWWVGGVIGFAGACLHAVALSVAPLVAVQPVSVATLVFAVPLAAMMYGRKPHRAEIIGSIAVAAGLIGLMALVPHEVTVPHMSNEGAIAFLACVGVIALVGDLVARRTSGPVKALVLSIGAGAVTASVSIFVRVVGGGFGGDFGKLVHWFTLAIPLLLVCAIILLQRSYAVGYFGIAYAGVQVVDPVTSVIAGAVLLGEPLPSGSAAVLPALVAAGLLIAGTITLGRLAPDSSHHAPAPAPKPVPVNS
ncbi:drug/metabolite transporter (DMT)-like permease [Thermocatellispora tengchongensis]|uniref:Drug/metabolite transporter (DMT)-like permease n=1 Tax=Thermocatellispora tengchongensis TaxID=1073253 RepID=A0A840PCZ2_9ACTN|nr:DMT family transporter [Thermocatellispora tengchongensis]MBB5136576.1 drug/metabolite transporter (DMT)-like permease [Thermocatellispora tengchongensis]